MKPSVFKITVIASVLFTVLLSSYWISEKDRYSNDGILCFDKEDGILYQYDRYTGRVTVLDFPNATQKTYSTVKKK